MIRYPTQAIRTAVVITGFLLSGCGSDPQKQIAAPVPPVPSSQPAVNPDAPRPDQPVIRFEADSTSSPAASDSTRSTSPDKLARQVEEHAKAIEALLAARQAEQDQLQSVKIIPGQTAGSSGPSPVVPPVSANPYRSGTTQPSHVTFVEPSNPPASDRSAPPTIPKPVSEVTSGALTSQANTPLTVTSDPSPVAPASDSGISTVMIDSLEQKLARRAREYPRDLPSQLDYQLLLFTKDESVPRNSDLAGLTTEDRELLTALMDGLTNFRNAVRADNNLLMNRKIKPLLDMSDRLRSRADLSIPNALLCREVKGFGTYTPLETTRFEAGKAHKVIVYSEVDNFSSVLNDKNLWETRLEQELVLYTESGLPVWEEKTPTMDVCRNRRRDFFIARIITLPANLTLGRYVLKVSITDSQAGRIAETSIPLAVVAR